MTVCSISQGLSEAYCFHFAFSHFTLQERCCHSRALRVTLQRESEIACMCAGGFMYFVVNKMSYFFISRPVPLLSFACTHSYYAYKMTNFFNVFRMCLRCKKSSKLSSFRLGVVARSEVCPCPAHSFVETWSWKNFYGHSPSSAESRRAVVSYWRKNVHYALINCLGGLPSNNVVRVTDHARNELKCVEGL